MSILIAGDYIPSYRVACLIHNKEYAKVFSNVSQIIGNYDLSIVNLEAPVIKASGIPQNKTGPHVKCTVNAIEALKYAGINMVTLANNHLYDFGEVGVSDTLQTCRINDIDCVGGGMNITDARRVVYKRVHNLNIAILNFCENEFSIATQDKGGANPLDIVSNYYDIQVAKGYADFVVVIIHGGHEDYQLPSPRMKKTYRYFVDIGADAVFNHHQHCYSGYEIYRNRPIFYGLGNFSFDSNKRNSNWNYGFMVGLIFNANKVDFKLYPYIQGDICPGIEILNDCQIKEFHHNLDSLNTVIQDDDLLGNSFEQFILMQSVDFKLLFEPYESKISRSLFYHGLLPSISQKKYLKILANVQCESHRDKLLFFLTRYK